MKITTLEIIFLQTFSSKWEISQLLTHACKYLFVAHSPYISSDSLQLMQLCIQLIRIAIYCLSYIYAENRGNLWDNRLLSVLVLKKLQVLAYLTSFKNHEFGKKLCTLSRTTSIRHNKLAPFTNVNDWTMELIIYLFKSIHIQKWILLNCKISGIFVYIYSYLCHIPSF